MPAVRVWIFTVGEVDVEIVWGVKVGNIIVDGGRRFNGFCWSLRRGFDSWGAQLLVNERFKY